MTHAINYTEQSHVDAIRQLYPNTGDGVDVVLNSLGGETIKQDLSILRAGGRVVGFGGAGLFDRPWYSIIGNVLSMLTLNSIDLLMASTGMYCCCCCCLLCTTGANITNQPTNEAAFYGVNMKRIGDCRPDTLRRELVELLSLFESGQLMSHVTQVLNWHRIGEAHTAMETRATSGKIILFVADASVAEFVSDAQ